LFLLLKNNDQSLSKEEKISKATYVWIAEVASFLHFSTFGSKEEAAASLSHLPLIHSSAPLMALTEVRKSSGGTLYAAQLICTVSSRGFGIQMQDTKRYEMFC